MLQASTDQLARLSPDLRALAEEMTSAVLVAGLKEDLLPPERAAEIVREHKDTETEDWLRALTASVASLHALHELGYSLTRR